MRLTIKHSRKSIASSEIANVFKTCDFIVFFYIQMIIAGRLEKNLHLSILIYGSRATCTLTKPVTRTPTVKVLVRHIIYKLL